ncbi:MAG TPA: cytochrome c [Gammaproteobacteria bacterium]|nr:cytochrome c [Gammaproteobacteria bacterium]
MIEKYLISPGFLAVTLVAGLGTAIAQDDIGDAARGKEFYYTHGCYGCHGYNGETGARDLVGTNSPLVANVDTFLLYLRLRQDYAPVVPSTRMPSYPQSALSDADARDIFAYIRMFELNVPDIGDIPALEAVLESAARGAK